VCWVSPPSTTPKTPLTQKGIILRLRHRWRPVEFLFTGLDEFKRHRTSRNAALLAHYGFLSVFPMVVVLTTILGFVLEGHPGLRKTIVNSALTNVPIIGETLKNNPSSLHGNAAVLVIGLATTLWAGTKAFVAAQNGMNDIWEIPDAERPGLASARGRALIAIGVVGSSQVATGLVSGVIGVGGVAWWLRIVLIPVTIAINIAALMTGYRILTARRLDRQQLLPGAILAGIGFSILQVVGGSLVIRATKKAAPVYGTFASVIALLTWLSLHSIVALVGVEANAALDRDRKRDRIGATAATGATAGAPT